MRLVTPVGGHDNIDDDNVYNQTDSRIFFSFCGEGGGNLVEGGDPYM